MKKKLLSIVLCGILAFSVLGMTGCGAKEEAAPAAEAEATEEAADEAEDETEEAAEEETADDDAVTDETWTSLQDLYASLTEAYNATVEMYNDDSVAADQEIEDALAQAKELMEEVGNIDRSQVKESEAQNYVDAMLAINEIFGAVIDQAQPAESASTDLPYDYAYAGMSDDDTTCVFVASGDDNAAMIFYNSETNESGSFVGKYTNDEETGLISIYDESLDATLTFSMEEQGDGYVLDMGDEIGKATIGPITMEQFADAMKAVDEGSVPQF